ncbi:hypothetical protein D3P07_13905 [Paenibacillus sp. 1011MAR3C5]|uniref:hypothetical protein n=1 Tax=Paenibacillus sp. 1011MAR3C5 TaxID=1675787 RepID=UPI000E6D2753|nr:hypothetical protein [Paenibacillus sp. 1011MAR3C5]RJE87432.1 hypothetical protein D3P07_13905 [Paenibacillus sp. 1011MAR3C5]
MKKTVLAVLTVATILTACGSNQAGSSNQANNSNQVEQTQLSAQTEVVQENNKPAKESPKHDEWSSLPEYDTIIQNIDDKDYTFKTVTDNQGKRILLLADKQEGKEQYKSIFVKDTNRLKIIHLNGDEPIFNAVLEGK